MGSEGEGEGRRGRGGEGVEGEKYAIKNLTILTLFTTQCFYTYWSV